jgi:hypothetical protein
MNDHVLTLYLAEFVIHAFARRFNHNHQELKAVGSPITRAGKNRRATVIAKQYNTVRLI